MTEHTCEPTSERVRDHTGYGDFDDLCPDHLRLECGWCGCKGQGPYVKGLGKCCQGVPGRECGTMTFEEMFGAGEVNGH